MKKSRLAARLALLLVFAGVAFGGTLPAAADAPHPLNPMQEGLDLGVVNGASTVGSVAKTSGEVLEDNVEHTSASASNSFDTTLSTLPGHLIRTGEHPIIVGDLDDLRTFLHGR